MIKEKSNTVFRTTKYSQFKRLDANRPVKTGRVNKIKQSIEKVGYVQSPIIVNEKMEVIDGQGRLEALKQLQIPVDYIVVEGIGIKECRAMNINQANWTTIDFIESFAEEGNISYKHFLNLLKQYKFLGITVVNNALVGLSAVNHEGIKNGNFYCTEQDYNEAIKMLEYESKYRDIVKKIRGRADYIYMSIGFAFKFKDIDNDRLYEKISEKYERFIPPANMEQACEEISKIYNERLRGPKVYLVTEYKKYMDEKYGWYLGRYGNSRARHFAEDGCEK